MITSNETTVRPQGFSTEQQALLEQRRRGATRAPGIPRRSQPGGVPLSFAQERLWFLDQLEPESPLYNIPLALRLTGGLNQAALEKSLMAIIARHEVFRTRFMTQDGEPMQFVSAPEAADLSLVDLSGQSAARREAELKRLLNREARRPFNFTTDLLLRMKLFRLEEREHVLFLNMHHIVSDAWSWAVFFQELAAGYDGQCAGCAAALPELPVQYADFALWQRGRLQGDVFKKQLAYWKRQLAGAPAVLDLPADRPRPPTQTFAGARQTLLLPSFLAEEIKRLGRSEGATLCMTLLAAFKALLHRYTRQDDLVVGCPVAGRNHREIEPLIGFFVNTLALRTDLSGNPTFRELLQRVREVMVGACAHQDLPFEKLVEELHPARNSRFQPLIQTMFVLQNAPAMDVELAGLRVQPVEVEDATAKFDLTLFLEEGEAGLTATAEYNTDLFDTETIQRMLRHYQTLLEGAVAEPDRKISELPLMTAAERQQVLVEWNRTATEYPHDKTIPQLFEEQARFSPDETALVMGGKPDARLTYRELNERANRLARVLKEAGIGPGVIAGVRLERSPELIIALLGILKAGGAYLSLNPAYPEERQMFMLKDARAAVLITRGAARPGPVNGCRVIGLEAEAQAIAAQNPANLSAADGPQPTGLAYVSYTSGSTGKPKGVCVPHRAVVRLVKDTNYLRFDADETFLQLAPVAFDASTLEIWGALLNGARLVMFPPQTPSLAELGGFIEAHRITTLWLTAGLFHQMVEEQWESLRGVRQLLAGGDVLSVAHVKKALARLPGCRLVNGYGPTENTTFTACHQITARSVNGRSVPIGRPVANTQVYILDEQLQPVPPGVPGELFTGGDGLACGYLNRAELTANKFIRDPFSRDPQARLYRTGDLARWLPDGEIEFLGRADRQVKVRGFRVEPAEIETALMEYPGLGECVVTGRADGFPDPRLTAYYVTDGQAPPAADELRRHLRQKLPDYMIPAAFVRLRALPLDANGKVDRHNLPDSDPQEGRRQFVPPRDRVEAQLAKIWEDVLGVPEVGAADHFFDLGGHSLLAVRLVARIEKVFGKKIPVTAVFQSPTVGQLAGILREDREPTPGSSVVEIQPQGARPPLFLVHGVGGGMFWGYTNLSHCLGTDQPVFAFQSRGTDGRQEYGSIEELAAHYTADLRAHQPHGPYYLGGYCFGGNVAYEMARQLQAQGETVALLALINCAPPNSRYARIHFTPACGLKFFQNLAYWAGYVWQLKPAPRRDLLVWKLRAIKKKTLRLLGAGRAPGSEIDVEELVDLSAQPEDRRRLWEAHIQALMKHQPRPYAGNVTLFRTRGHSVLCSFDDAYGWREFAALGVTVHIVPGEHESILDETHAPALAEILKRCLGESQTQPQGNPR